MVCWKNIEWGDFILIFFCWVGGRIGMILNFKSVLFNIEMFFDFMFEGVELVNRVIEIVEAIELVLKEMDS